MNMWLTDLLKQLSRSSWMPLLTQCCAPIAKVYNAVEHKAQEGSMTKPKNKTELQPEIVDTSVAHVYR
jgi:hypothetical protein